jgi:hypothetical protein
MSSLLSIASAGASRALAQLGSSATRLASAEDTASLPEAAVDVVEAKTAARANLAVLRATDDLLGNLIDVLA